MITNPKHSNIRESSLPKGIKLRLVRFDIHTFNDLLRFYIQHRTFKSIPQIGRTGTLHIYRWMIDTLILHCEHLECEQLPQYPDGEFDFHEIIKLILYNQTSKEIHITKNEIEEFYCREIKS